MRDEQQAAHGGVDERDGTQLARRRRRFPPLADCGPMAETALYSSRL
jgi:hypothetical protein